MSAHCDAWPPERHEALVEMVRAGFSGAQIANVLGTTRNAIIGRCHRGGLRLGAGRPRLPPPIHRGPRPKVRRQQKDNPFWKFGPDHPVRRKGRAFRSRAFTDTAIAAAIARHLAGLSGFKSARSIGASWKSLKNWEKDAALMALGRQVFEAARCDATERAETARRLKALADAAETDRLTRINAPILAAMDGRARAICEARIAGKTLQEIAGEHGLTRERIRQIECKWRCRGLEVPGADALSTAAVALFGPTPTRARKKKAPRGPDRRLRENMSPEVRAQRAANGRARLAEYRARVRAALASIGPEASA